ncbi:MULTISPECIES: DnaJ domain-containing protein [unclassified Rathayibacter]|uniref:DnaJ domain-containing protein n=1 Tax=unclassified Rathayibacter TaxID=2609250 RepID=UPI00188C6B85|nr:MULTISPECIES: DnaJ domain-containing protein [unclassified Rathayibacter]MBF4462559.1 DnaJ domain-containing protein [Rathayibacter sp. VKM Ac-2879]MBF4503398.1 DnaJ domain-containing protein [Rathayibacter sp. VKM Ac-2878]
MPDSHAARTPYEVLGIAATASDEDLRRAYRRRLRETHPDTGGDAAAFHAVQLAWERIGSASARGDYDRGAPAPGGSSGAPFTGSPRPHTTSAVRARSYGHPGGAAREYYLRLVREWLGRGVEVADPFDPALVRSAPREIRAWLAKAQAEEATAALVGSLGIAYTIWNDVAVGDGGLKIDHLVLGPAGLLALTSADWGEEVRLRKGELEGPGLAEDDKPLASLTRAARRLGRELGVRFSASVVVVPDDALERPFEQVERGRHQGAVVVRRSLLPQLLRSGADPRVGGYGESFEVRTRVQNRVRFV